MLKDNNVQDVVYDVDSTLGVQRRKKNDDDIIESSSQKGDLCVSKDPIKWFGLLVPNALRQTQASFVRAVELSVDCTNIQIELQSMIAKKTFLLEKLKEHQTKE